MTTFCLGSIVWREYAWPFVQSLYRLIQLRPDTDMLMLAGDALVSRARGIVATRFLKHQTQDVLLFVDSDIHFQPQDAITVCEQAHAIGGIVGGAYTVRRGNGSFPACMLKQDEPVTFYDSNGPDLVDAEYVSGGFMAIARKVFVGVEMIGELPTLHDGTNIEHIPFFHQFENSEESEDWAFCQRARACGVPIKLNPKVRLRHIGAYGYHMEDMITTYPENGIVRVTRSGDDYTAELVG